ncbi:hypothetical protein BTJ68_07675 [Hortaea werneckii EXF-2000]|uniref:BTB domain-containing protein n=1 Tax=Hortaea werneckii EXF-2000 TaxID=1157616 RepID=A0A1Z5T5Y6_HORWE|nr:hypothetical protein BTJ68_07675 [Hortaea werneckii EXF-2000]
MENDQSPPSLPPDQHELVNTPRDAHAPSEASQVPEAPSIPRLSVTHPSQEQLPVSRPPLSAIGGRNRVPSTTRRAHFEDQVRSTADRRIIPRVEKDADDPTNPPATSSAHGRHRSNTLTTLSRLFAVRASTSPDASRQGSYLQQHPSTHNYGTSLSHRNLQTTSIQLGDLPDHLFTRGLLEGRHSDITVIAFNHPYHLHRLILDRAPFFTSALSAPWLESAAKEITVHPSDLDPNITQTAFELALKRLYGCSDPVEEEPEAIGLFAVGCWLEMKDLIDSAIESILRQMSPETLSPLIRLVTMNYYGRAGEKILASAKAMLCRDGSSMPLRFWSGIPADIVREMVGGDGFYIEGELERWVLAKRILDRRLKVRAYEAGLTVPSSSSSSSGLTGRSTTRRRRVIKKVPVEYWPRLTAVRFDSISTTSLFSPPVRRGLRSSSASSHANPPFCGGTTGLGVGGAPDPLHAFISLYTHPDIEPLLVLLDEGIHYIHLDFESLQFIRGQRDILGFPVMPEKVVNDALWMQMELRQKVINAAEGGLELGLSLKWTENEEEVHDESVAIGHHANNDATTTKGKQKASEYPPPPESTEHIAHNPTPHPLPQPFPVEAGTPTAFPANSGSQPPTAISSWAATLTLSSLLPILLPSNAMPNNSNTTTSSSSRGDIVSLSTRGMSNGLLISAPRRRNRLALRRDQGAAVALSLPPQERKRIYSQTVFYAGSLWNLYIQKVSTGGNRGSTSGGNNAGGVGGKQLGVYLHRAKERGDGDGGSGGSAASGGNSGRPSLDDQRNSRASVDERIGVLEREMRVRREREREVLGLGARRTRRRGWRVGGGGGGGGVPHVELEDWVGGRRSPASVAPTTSTGASGGGSLAATRQQGQDHIPRTSSAGPASIGDEPASIEPDNIRAAYPSGSSEEAMFTPASIESEWDSHDDFGDEFDADEDDLRDLEDYLDDDDDDYDEDEDLDEYGTSVGGAPGAGYPTSTTTTTSSSSQPAPPLPPHHHHSPPPPPPPHNPPPHRNSHSHPSTIPALPPYIDTRPTIKTYFKIFSPSRAGRMLSLYESAPDKFNFSQSWGWKSSTLMLDDGIFGRGSAPAAPGGGGEAEAEGEGGGNGVEGEVVGGEDGMGGGVGGADEVGGPVGEDGRGLDGGVLARDHQVLPGLMPGRTGDPAGAGGMDGLGHAGRGRGGGGVVAGGGGDGVFASSPSDLPPSSRVSPRSARRMDGVSSTGSGSRRRTTSTMAASTMTSSVAAAGTRGKGDGKLRFMVVIGNV